MIVSEAFAEPYIIFNVYRSGRTVQPVLQSQSIIYSMPFGAGGIKQ